MDVIETTFAKFWKAYPSRGEATNPRKPALEKFRKLVEGGTDPAVIVAGAQGYAAAMRRDRTEPRFIKQATAWLTQACWQQYADPPPNPLPSTGKSLAERLGITPLGF